MQQHPSKYVSAMEIAWDLQVTERTVRTWMSNGELPVVSFGPKCVRVPREAFESFVRTRAAVAV